MKKQLIILLIAALIAPVLAEETNKTYQRRGDDSRVAEKRKRPEWTEEQRKEQMERRYQFMDKALSEIGVSDDDKIKIRALQETHRQKMRENGKRVTAAREKLSKFQDDGATEEEIETAIQDVSDASTEQLRILVRNRMEMEKILGKEKYALFMKNARKQFQKHGSRSGSGMPPRPGLPPLPNEGEGDTNPPLPNSQALPPSPPPPGK